jgi:dimethylaniline monooxygenase (N-oxide forming)
MPEVVVVGAGPCGLAALKEMLTAGHNAVLLEKTDKLGGVFASAVCDQYCKDDTTIYLG